MSRMIARETQVNMALVRLSTSVLIDAQWVKLLCPIIVTFPLGGATVCLVLKLTDKNASKVKITLSDCVH